MLFLASEESSIMLSLVRTILMFLCNVVYSWIITVYELFMAIGSATLLSSEQIQIIYNRVGLILGIIMIFRLMFSFIQYMIDPDKISDKESGVGSLIKKVIVVILALGLTDWVFNKAFEIQDIILEENTIGKVVLGISTNDDVGMEEFGTLFSYHLFTNFFYQNPEINQSGAEAAEKQGCGATYFDTTLKKYVATYKDFEIVNKCLNEEGTPDGGYAIFGNKVYYAGFDGLTALVVGCIVLWVLLMYTITLAVRVVKLAFLRIIAPIPILSYITPKKDTAFQKWIKQCVTTYLDLFIRLAIIYFCMLLISVIFVNGEVAKNSSTYLSPSNKLYIAFNVILVLGILIFAKKVPEILGEIFPSLGGKGGLDFGFGLKSRADFLGKGAFKRATGAAIGAGAIGALGLGQGIKRLSADGGKEYGWKKFRNAFAGMGTGVVRGAASGLTNGGKIGAGLKKGFKGQVAASQATNKYIASGSDDFIARTKASIASTLGLPSRYEEIVSEIKTKKDEIAVDKRQQSAAKKVVSAADAIGDKIKEEILGDKANLLITKDSEAFIEHMEKKGFATVTRDPRTNKITDARIKYGTMQVKDANGNMVPKDIEGKSMLGMQACQIDNEFKSELMKADNRLNTANASLVNSQSELAKVEASLRADPNNGALRNQKAQILAEIGVLEEEVNRASEQRNVYNETEFVKALKIGGISEALLGGYDSDDVKQNLLVFDSSIEMARASNDEKIQKLSLSKKPEDIRLKEQYQASNEIQDKLKKFLQDVKDNYVTETEDNDGKKRITYDMAQINRAIKDLINNNAALFANSPNFDDIKADGTFGTRELKIKTLYDVFDNIGELNKRFDRGSEINITQKENKLEILENSEDVLALKNADENRQQWGP